MIPIVTTLHHKATVRMMEETKKRLKMANNQAKKETRKERTTETENNTMNCLTFPLSNHVPEKT